MNWHIVEGSWKQIKGQARRCWGSLTDSRRHVIAGNRIELAGRQQQAHGFALGEAERQAQRLAVRIKGPRAK